MRCDLVGNGQSGGSASRILCLAAAGTVTASTQTAALNHVAGNACTTKGALLSLSGLSHNGDGNIASPSVSSVLAGLTCETQDPCSKQSHAKELAKCVRSADGVAVGLTLAKSLVK